MKTILKNLVNDTGNLALSVTAHGVHHVVLYGYTTKTVTLSVELLAEGAEVFITGLLVGKEGDCTLHTVQRHVAPHTTSDLLVKTVVGGTAGFTYHGAIMIEKGAQHANAYQRNENILLSPGAHVDTRPELEIQANEVRCTHGATVGKLDELMLFYLVSRGLPRPEAEALALNGFLSSAIKRIPDNGVQMQLQEYIQREL